MLMVSERWLTTQACVSLRAATVTGSRPTGIDAWCWIPPSSDTANTSRRASGVFTTRSVPPEGVRAIGWTWEDSKFTYCARTGPRKICAPMNATATIRHLSID